MKQKCHVLILWLIRENVVVATAVTSLAISTLLIFRLPMAYAELLSLWVGTVLSYSFAKEGRLRYDRPIWWLLAATACGAFLFLSWTGRGILLLSMVLSVAYDAPFLTHRLRSIPFLKIIIVSICWVLGSVYLPLSDYKVSLFAPQTSILAGQYLLWVVVLILPFDIRDKQAEQAHLQTLPTILGTPKTKAIGTLLMLLFVLLAFVHPTFLLYIQVIIACITVLSLLFAHEHQSPYYSALWVESLPIIYMVLMAI
jgi:putative membrane protein